MVSSERSIAHSASTSQSAGGCLRNQAARVGLVFVQRSNVHVAALNFDGGLARAIDSSNTQQHLWAVNRNVVRALSQPHPTGHDVARSAAPAFGIDLEVFQQIQPTFESNRPFNQMRIIDSQVRSEYLHNRTNERSLNSRLLHVKNDDRNGSQVKKDSTTGRLSNRC